MFPQDYEFRKEELVLLWMAEGFLQAQCNKRMEDVGDQYFGELLSRSFFQRSGSGKSVFLMHDLIHDLAKSTSKEICFNLGDGIKVHESWKNDKSLVCHILISPADKFKVMSSFGEARRLRSLIFDSKPEFYVSKWFLHDLVPELTCLRVLSLECCKNIKELPESIGKLKGLRYLNLRHMTAIKRLPESMSTLYNLQTLILSYCFSLEALPNDIGSLIDLRHLLIDFCINLEKLPLGIGKLTNLQSLPAFTVEKHDGSKIKELRDMQQLREILSIERLGNVVDTWEATQANLWSKEHLRVLRLIWNDRIFQDNLIEEKVQEDVINRLQPHTNIRELTIRRYSGKRLPNWLGCSSYSFLETLQLEGCGNCECLPPLGCLRFLKHLVLNGLHRVKKVGIEFYGDVGVFKPFVSLESLKFSYMERLEEWFGIEEEFEEEFPCLWQLEIRNCPNLKELSCRFPQLRIWKISHCAKLISLPTCLPMLRELEIEGCDEMILRSEVESPPPLIHLCISGITNLKHIPLEEGRVMECLTTLQGLEIKECTDLVTLFPSLNHIEGGLQGFESLQRLKINGCTKLVCLSEVDEDRLPPKLEELEIASCVSLEKLRRRAHNITFHKDIIIDKCAKLVVSLREMASFSMLRMLEIRGCQMLEFPEEIMLPSTLKELAIGECDGFETLPVRIMHNATCLEELSITRCSSLVSFSEEMDFPSTLKNFRIEACRNLKTLPDGMMHRENGTNDSFIDNLDILYCRSLSSFTATASSSSSSRLPLLPKNIHIYCCVNLVALPVVMLHDNKFLETLSIDICNSLMSFERKCLGFDACADVDRDLDILSLNPARRRRRRTTIISNVKRIDIFHCKKLESLPSSMYKLTSLQCLTIGQCDRLASFPDGGLPTTTLKELEISNCESLNPIPKEGFPGTITRLTIRNCKKQKPMSEWGLHKLTSLTSLSIERLSGLVSLPVCLLPPNLTHLCIKKLPDLQFLPEGLGSLTSLERLEIIKCAKLVPFVETVLPSSISELHVSGCPALEEWCAQETEKDGSNMVKVSFQNQTISRYKFF